MYQDKDWIKTIQEIMLKGWRAKLSAGYIKKLKTHLKLDFVSKTSRAYDVFQALGEALYKENKKSDMVYLMLEKPVKPDLPPINRRSWELGFAVRLAREPELAKHLTTVLTDNEKMTLKEFTSALFASSAFVRDLWKDDVEQILFALETHNIVKLKVTASTGDVVSLVINHKDNAHKKLLDTNSMITYHWMGHYLAPLKKMAR